MNLFNSATMQKSKANLPIRFAAVFICLFLLFYYFNIFFFGLTSSGGKYSAFLAKYLNYIDWLRWGLLHTSASILNTIGFKTIVSKYELLVAGHGVIKLVYTCLGLGIMSFITAFVIAYPKPLRIKLISYFTAILGLQVLNVIRLVLLALYWDRNKSRIVDHHLIFDIIIYIIIVITIYFWVNYKSHKPDVANRSVEV
jgi:exosortase/archaeosortase family protein